MDYNNLDIIGKKVRVYRNLHKKCYSVQYNRKVVSHEDNLFLIFPKFKVSQAGRDRVLREKRKNVHAFVDGTVQVWKDMTDAVDKAAYNPYRWSSFVRVHEDNISYLGEATHVWVTEHGLYIPSTH